MEKRDPDDPTLSVGWVVTDIPTVNRSSKGAYDWCDMSDLPQNLLSYDLDDFEFYAASSVPDDDKAEQVLQLNEKAKSEFDLDLSSFFLKFMTSSAAQASIRSNTGCYFSLDEDIHELPKGWG